MEDNHFAKLLEECENHQGSCGTCNHYKECLNKFPPNSEKNNPTMLFWEIHNNSGLKYAANDNNFHINICEATEPILNQSIEISDRLPNEVKKIVRSGIEKFVASSDEDATIISLDNNLYHFVFECSDCFAKNDFTDYCMNDEIYFHCRYCGKKHKFILPKKE